MMNNFRRCNLAVLACCLLVLATASLAQDSGWPRKQVKNGSTLITYQPQVDDWINYKDLDLRLAFSLTPPGGKPVIGVAMIHGQTEVYSDRDLVVINNVEIRKLNFPSLDPASAASMDQLTRTLVDPSVVLSLHRLVACLPKPESVAPVVVRNDPPAIFVAYRPAILLFVDGKPILAPVKDTGLQFVVNTTWPLFFDSSKSAYYLLVGQEWLTAGGLQGPWTTTVKLPPDMAKVATDPDWATLKGVIPPPKVKAVSPQVFYSATPGEVVLFNGQPTYAAIPGTQLTYATNTPSNVFVYGPSRQFYYLTAGRWFSAAALEGPWTFATATLPADFAQIPSSSPAGRVLASVPGTDEAKDAVLLAQVPTTLVVDPAAAAAQAKVTYSGEPQFAPIDGTSLSYATNTEDKVIRVGDVYYLCLQGVWFMSTTAQGPWTTASSVPQEIYTIPPSSPVYNVTYVTQVVDSGGFYTSSYTAGYMGSFVVVVSGGVIVTSGSGYYYPPYMYYPAYGYPIYHPYAMTYGYGYGSVGYYHTGTGAYGVSQSVYGPYGSATRSASYNPYTGTYARSGSVSTPYGSRSAAQAYNPYTGRYAATAQGSSPGAQWGSSVTTKGNQSAYSQHVTTAQGTRGSVQTSSGGKAAGYSGAGGSSGYAGKTSSGDMYAGKDGNAYKNTGSGWQKYDNGSWNSVNKPTSASAQQHAESAPTQRPASGSGSGSFGGGGYSSQDLNKEQQNRQRGSAQSGSFQGFGGGGGGGRSFGGGRRR